MKTRSFSTVADLGSAGAGNPQPRTVLLYTMGRHGRVSGPTTGFTASGSRHVRRGRAGHGCAPADAAMGVVASRLVHLPGNRRVYHHLHLSAGESGRHQHDAFTRR